MDVRGDVGVSEHGSDVSAVLLVSNHARQQRLDAGQRGFDIGVDLKLLAVEGAEVVNDGVLMCCDPHQLLDDLVIFLRFHEDSSHATLREYPGEA